VGKKGRREGGKGSSGEEMGDKKGVGGGRIARGLGERWGGEVCIKLEKKREEGVGGAGRVREIN